MDRTLYQNLYEAVSEGRLDEAKNLLQKGLDVNNSNYFPHREGLIFPAIREENVEMVEYLLSKGYDIDEGKNRDGLKAIHVASQYGNLRVLDVVLRAGVWINAVSGEHNLTPLGCAVRWGKTEAARVLLDTGAKVNKKYYKHGKKTTALHEAVRLGLEDMVDVLLEAGADVNIRDSRIHQFLPIHLVGSSSKPSPCLIDQMENSPVEDSDVRILRRLIRCGSRLNDFDRECNSPLHSAVSRSHLGLVRELLVSGAAIDSYNRHFFTPLAAASLYGRVNIARLLLDFGASLEKADMEGRTPLILAAGNYELITFSSKQDTYFNIIKLLVEAGANIEHADNMGHKVLNLCIQETMSPEPLEFLLNKGASYTAIPRNGMTAMMVVCGRHQTPLFDVILCLCPGLVHSPEYSPHWPSLSPLCQLARNHTNRIPALLSAGYRGLQAELNFMETPSLRGNPPAAVLDTVREHLKTPHSLLEISRARIRFILWDKLYKKVDKLPLPSTLKGYLLLSDCLPVRE